MNQEGIDGKVQSNSLKEAKLVSLIKNPNNKENYEKALELASNNPDTKIVNDEKNDSSDFS
jgi:hypothetical protein